MAKATNGVQSVERALDIIESLANADGELGLTDLVTATGLPLATVHRLLTTLVGRGYVSQAPQSRRYLLGPSVLTCCPVVSPVTGVLPCAPPEVAACR